ncbi:MAG TPA: DUF502 domain-containing protein [Isosphaeraceae bacterium]|nr:DUF502 domain-containing protein [Isosphaeraceae bacterium]
MESPTAKATREVGSGTRPSAEPAPSAAGRQSWFSALRSRLVGGLLVVLPIAITLWIVYWLLVTLQRFLLDPLAIWVNRLQAWIRNAPPLQSLDLPDWWYEIASPVLAIVLALAILYVLGLVLRSWVYRTINWFLLHVPVVATIYRAVSNVINSLGTQFQGGTNFKRVVLVDFPHPGMRSLGLVTNSLRDATTGRTILTVCVLTGVMPPTGFTFFVPEESVTNIAWNVNETLQAILSGGLTAPETIHYFEGLRAPLPPSGGPIVDVRGNVLTTAAPDPGVETTDELE